MQIPGYRVIRKINQGGMSTVYLAIQISVGRVVALKVMSPTLNGDPAFSERFQREANIVGQLSHPNIVAIYDIGRHENLNYIAMDYLPGGSVHDRMMKGISANEARNITRDIAIALDHAHEKGYVHRDIKPENILFRADHSAVLTDFGVAKGVGVVSRMTNVGQVVGTPHYMSPEQTRGKDLDARSDLYSLGVVFYEMLTGSVPFQGNEAVTIAIKHISAQVPRLPTQYQAYQKIIDKLLAKDPDQRFQKGRDLAQALDELETGGKSSNGTKSNPADLSTPALLRALAEASYRGIHWRLRRLAQWRWAPKKGFYRRSTTRMTELVFTDEERSTLIATRIQDALLHPGRNKRRWLTIGLIALAGVVLLWGAGRLLFGTTPSTVPVPTPVVSQPATTQASPANPETATQTPGELPNADLPPAVQPEAVQHQIPPQEQSVTENTLATTNLPPPMLQRPLEIYEPAPLEVLEGVPDEPATEPGDESPVTAETAEAPPVTETTESQAATTPVASPPKRFKLTISPEPADARVRILNIGPRYTPGIALEPGRYHIEVSHPGHATHTDWITLEATNLTLPVVLEARREIQGPFTSELANGRQGPSMTPVPKGSFTMGSESEKRSSPRHNVSFSYGFAISQYEITFAEYDLFAKATDRALPGDNRWGRDRRPVINVSWEDARAYTEWLSEMTGERYRLPTESEWEYVARAGSGGNYWWGDESAEGKANCRRGCNSRFSGLFGAKTAPVGTYPANAFGVYDTAGNVAEWMQDCFADSYAAKPLDGRAYEQPNCSARVVRGGAARDNLDELTSHARDYHPPVFYDEQLGFRVVMELD